MSQLPYHCCLDRTKEAHSLILPDGCTKYFFNVTAPMDKVPSDLQAFFRYTVNAEGREEERQKTVQALLERDDAIAEIKRLKKLLRENGIETE